MDMFVAENSVASSLHQDSASNCLVMNGIFRSPRVAIQRGEKADKNAMEKNMNERCGVPDQNFEQSAGQYVGRIAWLETCNAILHDKLIRAEKELASLKQELARINI